MRGGTTPLPLTVKEKIAKFNALSRAAPQPAQKRVTPRDSLEQVRAQGLLAATKMKKFLEKVNKEISALEKEELRSEANILKILKGVISYAHIKNPDIQNRLFEIKKKAVNKFTELKKPPADAYMSLQPSPKKTPSPAKQAPVEAPAQELTNREQKLLEIKNKREALKKDEEAAMLAVLNDLEVFLNLDLAAQAPKTPSPQVKMRKNNSGKHVKRGSITRNMNKELNKERTNNTKVFLNSLKRTGNNNNKTMKISPVRGLPGNDQDVVYNPLFQISP